MKLNRHCRIVFGHQARLGCNFTAIFRALPDMAQKSLPVCLNHIIAEGLAGYSVSVRAKHLGPGKINLLHKAVLVKCGVAQRGEIIQVYIKVPVSFQKLLSLAQLPVLFRQLLLMLSQFGNQMLDLLRLRRQRIVDVCIKRFCRYQL